MTKTTHSLDFAAVRAAELEPWLAYFHGNRFARVLAVKGEPGSAELAGKPPFFGEDGEAFESALNALGFESNAWCGIVPCMPHIKPLSSGELRLLIETIDPQIVIALDACAAELIQKSYTSELLPEIPPPGKRVLLLGRDLLVLDGFETALVSEPQDGGEAKRRIWKELKTLKKER